MPELRPALFRNVPSVRLLRGAAGCDEEKQLSQGAGGMESDCVKFDERIHRM